MPANDLYGRSVLVTGGLGFLGLNLLPALLRSGAAVRVLNRSAHPLALRWMESLRNGGVVTVERGDIAEADRLHGWLEGVDLVVNLAGESGAVKSLREAQTDMQVNIAGHLSLLDAIRLRPSPPRVVFVSSRLVYGVTGKDAVGEDHPTKPTSLYGLHKLTVEHYYRIYRQHYGIPYSILRVTNPYGPFQLPQRTHYGVINRFIMRALRGETIQIFGDGEQLRDYVHVEDVADAVLAALAYENALGETFNVGSGRSIAIGEVARRIVATTRSGAVERVPWPEGYRNVETGDFVCDVGKIHRLLGWRAAIDLDRGLEQTVACYRSLLS